MLGVLKIVKTIKNVWQFCDHKVFCKYFNADKYTNVVHEDCFTFGYVIDVKSDKMMTFVYLFVVKKYCPCLLF